MLHTLTPSQPESICFRKKQAWKVDEDQSHTYLQGEKLVQDDESSALVAAVRSCAPLHVIHTILEANQDQICMSSADGGSVLHEALKHRADDSVLGHLLAKAVQFDQSQESRESILGGKDEFGRTALHYMVDRVVRALDRGDQSPTGWDIFRVMVEAYPQAAAIIDADGTTPLVLLLLIPKLGKDSQAIDLEDAVFHMAQLMLALCPHAVRVSRRLPRPWHYHFHREEENPLLHGDGVPSPLSCAILHGRSLRTIELLLDANRKIGVRSCHSVVTHYGEIPLHIASSMRCQTDILQRIANEDHGVLQVRDIHGLTPLDWVWVRHTLDWYSSMDPFAPMMVSRRRYIHNYFLEWHQQVTNQYLGIDKASDDHQVREMTHRIRTDLLKRMDVFLPSIAAQSMQAETHSMVVENEMNFPLVQAAALVSCPLAMVRLACDAYPEQLWTKDQYKGRLPLHYACGRGGYKVQYPVGVSCNVRSIEEMAPMYIVLALYPTAARITDDQLQLPLHVTIDYIKSNAPSPEDGRDATCRYPGIDALLKVYPESLHCRDGVTKLYPFQQAAEGVHADLELTFELLRRDPSLILSTHC